MPSRAYLDDPNAQAISHWREPQIPENLSTHEELVAAAKKGRDGFFRAIRRAFATLGHV